MVEGFEARPGEIAGLSNAVAEIAGDNQRIADFVGQNGPPNDSFSGEILSTLLPPLIDYADATKARMADMANVNGHTSVELNKAA